MLIHNSKDGGSGQGLVWSMRIVALGALGTAIFLAWSTLVAGKVAGCGGGSVMDCNHVLQSKYSSVWGVPVSIPAALVYVILLGCLFAVKGKHEGGPIWDLISLCILSAAAAALWFTGVQVLILGMLCWYCLVVHGCGLLLAGMLVWLRPLHPERLGRLFVPSALGVLALACVQHTSPEPKTFEVTTELAVTDANVGASSMTFDMSAFDDDMVDDEATHTSEDAAASRTFEVPEEFTGDPVATMPSPTLSPTPEQTTDEKAADGELSAATKLQRYVDFRFAKVKLNTYDWPIIGSPAAEHVLLELFDYTCPHCQQMNVQLKAAQERYGDQVAILVLPVPLNKNCNPHYTKEDPRHADACELARLALSVWRLSPDQFADFHEYLFTTTPRPTALDARKQAETIVDPAKLKAYISGSSVSRYITTHANILKQAGGAPLPRVESEAFSLKGKTNNLSDLFETLESQLGVKP
jgi:uncharacterized membrane protein/protein-disulfide isomerase